MSEDKDGQPAVFFFPVVLRYMPPSEGEEQPDGTKTHMIAVKLDVEGMLGVAHNRLQEELSDEDFEFWLEQYAALWLAKKACATTVPMIELPNGWNVITPALELFVQNPTLIAKALELAKETNPALFDRNEEE